MSLVNTTKPLLLGQIAVYAPDFQMARQVYMAVLANTKHQAFGTVQLDSGEEVDWVDMAHYARPPSHAQ